MQIFCGKYLCGIAVILTDIKSAVLPSAPIRGEGSGVGSNFKEKKFILSITRRCACR